MIGVIVIVVALVLAIPVGVMLGGAVWSALVGWLLSAGSDTRVDARANAPTHAQSA